MSLLMDELKKAERSQRTIAAGLDAEVQSATQTPTPPVALSPSLRPAQRVFMRLTTVGSCVKQAAVHGWRWMMGRLVVMPRFILEASCAPSRGRVIVVVVTMLLGVIAAISVWALHGKHTGLLSSDLEKQEAMVTVSVPATPPPSLQRAEAALKAGKTEQARAEYQRLLSAQPDHLEALRGLATISQQAGQHEVASGYYQRILRIAPQDVQAQLAWASVQSQSDPSGAEKRLKALIASQPRLASAHDALGKLYVGQERWSEAQAAFLQAYRIEPDKPDILYSLAISYDHLQQVRQALMFYRLAQKAATTHAASFDRNRMNTRIEMLMALLEP